ncbi:MAG: PhzF family phenazine biosynthesis protein [Bacteroidales bacterium]|nr:PhzF family phenazine biosynthesis protein [Candidatus Cacconaster merdequi]
MKDISFLINAFVDHSRGFTGNSAYVLLLERWLPADEMLRIARRNGVAETAFAVRNPSGSEADYSLRWFTPDIEMDLCGHATLATAFTIFTCTDFGKSGISFSSNSGILKASISGDVCTLDLPPRPASPSELPQQILDSLSIKPLEVFKARDYLLVYEDERDISGITIDRRLFDSVNIDPGGIAVTAPGHGCDFVSRFFTPQATILEDPVTGSAHCSLVPYWSRRLGKDELTACQLSQEGGTLFCLNTPDRVFVGGKAEVVKKTEINFG